MTVPPSRWPVAFLLLTLLFLTRWPFKPSVLLTFDNANFALALSHFDPALHRPQPPGYPLFVDLARAIHVFVEDVPTVFFLAGMLGAFVAVWMTWRLGLAMAGPAAGICAGLLMVVHPAMWSANFMNPVRTWLAAGSAAVAYYAYRCWRREDEDPKAWPLAWLALGIAAGFRPGLSLYVVPLLLLAGYRRRTSLTGWVVAGACLTLGVLPWLIQLLVVAGSVEKYLALLQGYLAHQSESSSIVYGAALMRTLKMAGSAVAWLFVGAAGWIWFVRSARVPQPLFLAVWFVPAFLFLTIVHSAEPGHVLVVAPALCVAGGWVLSNVRVAARAVAVLVPAVLFFAPPKGVLRDASMGNVRYAETHVKKALDDIRASGVDAIKVTHDAPASWRLVSFYFPDMTVIVDAGDDLWYVRENQLKDNRPAKTVTTAGLLQLDGNGLRVLP